MERLWCLLGPDTAQTGRGDAPDRRQARALSQLWKQTAVPPSPAQQHLQDLAKKTHSKPKGCELHQSTFQRPHQGPRHLENALLHGSSSKPALGGFQVLGVWGFRQDSELHRAWIWLPESEKARDIWFLHYFAKPGLDWYLGTGYRVPQWSHRGGLILTHRIN